MSAAFVIEPSLAEIIEIFTINHPSNRRICPVCGLVKRSVVRCMQQVYSEMINEPKLRAEVRSRLGFCQRHSDLATTVGDPLGNSILFADLVHHSKAEFAPTSNISRRVVKQPTYTCTYCDVEHDAQTRYLHALTDGLNSMHGLWDKLENSPAILCVAHARRLVRLLNKELVPQFNKIYLIQLEKLEDDLKEFIRKNDYRSIGETLGDEQLAWQQAISLFSKK